VEKTRAARHIRKWLSKNESSMPHAGETAAAIVFIAETLEDTSPDAHDTTEEAVVSAYMAWTHIHEGSYDLTKGVIIPLMEEIGVDLK
jgi:hypothetical protein